MRATGCTERGEKTLENSDMSKKSIGEKLSQYDEDSFYSRLDDICSIVVTDSAPAELNLASKELSRMFCGLVRSDWRAAAELFAVRHCEFWASLPTENQKGIVVEALRESRTDTLEPLIMTVADRSVDHMAADPEIAKHWLRLCRESDLWADYCSFAVRVPSGRAAREWLEAT